MTSNASGLFSVQYADISDRHLNEMEPVFKGFLDIVRIFNVSVENQLPKLLLEKAFSSLSNEIEAVEHFEDALQYLDARDGETITFEDTALLKKNVFDGIEVTDFEHKGNVIRACLDALEELFFNETLNDQVKSLIPCALSTMNTMRSTFNPCKLCCPEAEILAIKTHYYLSKHCEALEMKDEANEHISALHALHTHLNRDYFTAEIKAFLNSHPDPHKRYYYFLGL